MQKETRGYAIAIAAGATSWLGVGIVSGRSEAWDSPLYWSVAYPLLIAIAAVLGYRHPERPWRWALAMLLVQPVILAATASGFGLLPLGLILFAFLSLPAVAAAFIGARLSRRARSA